jgi:predicted TIM-barrel fold metal-dependent hydrolase
MDTIVLDVHAHLVPVTLDLVSSLSGVTWDAQSQAMTIDGHLLATKALFQADVLLAWMDKNTIGHAWISIPPPAYRQALDEIGAGEWAVYVNDGLASIAAKHPDRLSALLHLPVEHPVLAVEVVRNGARKFAMSAGAGPNVWLSDPVYEPLWKALDERAAFLFIHPGTTCDPRLYKYFLRNLFGNPTETGVAATHLAISGVMSRFARMTVCLAHGGVAIALGIGPVMVLHVLQGMKAVDSEIVEMAHVFRLSTRDKLVHIWIPSLIPHLIGGARVGLSLGWKVIVLVELFGLSNGVGYQLNSEFSSQNVAGVLAWTIVFWAVMVVIEYGVLQSLERASSKWRRVSDL